MMKTLEVENRVHQWFCKSSGGAHVIEHIVDDMLKQTHRLHTYMMKKMGRINNIPVQMETLAADYIYIYTHIFRSIKSRK